MDQFLYQIGFVVLLIILNGLFAGAEIALVSVSRSKIRMLAQQGNKKARAVSRLVGGDPNRYLAAIQIGITMTGFLASASAAVTLAVPLQTLFAAVPVGVISGNAQGLAVFITTLIIAFASLVYGELVPKRAALQASEPIALFFGRPIELFSRIVSPIITLLSAISNGSLRLMGFKVGRVEHVVSEDELKQIIAHQSTLHRDEQRLLYDVFEFGDTHAHEVMVPRTEIVGVTGETPIAETLKLMASTGYGRMPVYGPTLDDIIGVTNIQDLVPYVLNNQGNKPTSAVVREAYFVPGSIPISELLKDMQQQKVSMAIIVDEFGGTDGLVTVKSILEELVGDIPDEHDREPPDIVTLQSGDALVKGSAEIEDVNLELKLSIPHSPHYNTIGGFMLERLKRIPRTGDSITLDGVTFTVAKMGGNRILQVRIHTNHTNQGDGSPDRSDAEAGAGASDSG